MKEKMNDFVFMPLDFKKEIDRLKEEVKHLKEELIDDKLEIYSLTSQKVYPESKKIKRENILKEINSLRNSLGLEGIKE